MPRCVADASPLLSPQAPLWEDDYQEIVSEAEDVWGREAAAVDDTPLAPPPWLAAPAPADSAAEAPSDAPGALSSAYSPAQGFRRAPPFLLRLRTSGCERAA